MTDERTVPTFVYEGLDPVAEPKSAIAQAVELLSEVVAIGTSAIHRIGDAIDKGQKPGMPLSILSSDARETPLGSLLVAFFWPAYHRRAPLNLTPNAASLLSSRKRCQPAAIGMATLPTSACSDRRPDVASAAAGKRDPGAWRPWQSILACSARVGSKSQT
jgi:hypothetical protein